MPRYVAFLRGVSPLNARMLDLKRAFEAAGFTEVKTVLSSGNVAFTTLEETEIVLARRAEAAMTVELNRTFYTIVRRANHLRDLVEADPYGAFDLPVSAKRIVTFLGEPPAARPSLPIRAEDIFILAMYGDDVLTAYISGLREHAVLPLLEKMCGKTVTTRTWQTVKKCSEA